MTADDLHPCIRCGTPCDGDLCSEACRQELDRIADRVERFWAISDRPREGGTSDEDDAGASL